MIITECYKDTVLVHRIGFPGDQVKHEFGRSRVLGRVEQKQKAVIGIIDEDPGTGQPLKMKEYEFQSGDTKAIRLLKKKDDKTKRLIQICPRLEDWLYVVAKRNRISPDKFGLPNNPCALHSRSLRGDDDFHKFLIALNKTKDDELNTLKRWIKEAIE
ncbi:hypothetical protein KKG61_00345 [bacterium]|nr:hypothetical protein [bacterium]MBU1598555.1 hypothetical protein [bacterium]MBU2462379.1 hypothetical protein [bacterium]